MDIRGNGYETIIILKEDLNKDEVKNIQDKYVHFLIAEDAEDMLPPGAVYEVTYLGKKQLAYEIKNNKYGYYLIFYHQCTADKIIKLERLFRIDDNIIKFITVRQNIDDTSSVYSKAPMLDPYNKNNKTEQKGSVHIVDALDIIFNLK